MTGLGALAAVGLLLAGCAAQPPPVPPGPTADEVRAIQDQQNGQWWDAMFPDVPPPHIQVVAEVSGDEWQQSQIDCLKSMGLDVAASGGGISYSAGPNQSDGDVNYASYVCTLEYPVAAAGSYYLSAAQIEYMYDFYANRLAPCMRLLGYVVSEPPSRTVFVDSFYTGGSAWTPYRVQPMIQEESKWDQIDLRCGKLPEPFPRYH